MKGVVKIGKNRRREPQRSIHSLEKSFFFNWNDKGININIDTKIKGLNNVNEVGCFVTIIILVLFRRKRDRSKVTFTKSQNHKFYYKRLIKSFTRNSTTNHLPEIVRLHKRKIKVKRILKITLTDDLNSEKVPYIT